MKRNAESPDGKCAKRKKAPRNTPSINLNYPYQTASNETIGGINPPFLDPNGPLVDNGDQLLLKTKPPIAILNKAVGIKIDNSLHVDENNQLGINVDCEGPLDILENGLNIKTDNSLWVDDWELGVQIAAQQPVSIEPEGITVHVDDTLLIEENTETGKHEIGVHLNLDGPITADAAGVDLEYDSSTLQVTNISGNNALGVKIKQDNPITKDKDGIFLLFNSSDFKDDSGQGLSLKQPMNYLSPYCWYEAGNSDLVSSTLYIRTSGTTNWNTGYHLLLTNSCGLINGMIHLRLDRSTFSNPGPQTETNKVMFTLALNITGEGYNPSNMSGGKAYPLSSMINTFKPNPRAVEKSGIVFPSGRDWYEAYNTYGPQLTFIPKGLNDAGFGVSYWSYWVAKASNNTNYLIVMNFYLDKTAGSSWFQTGRVQGIMDTGELYFNYQGSMPQLQ